VKFQCDRKLVDRVISFLKVSIAGRTPPRCWSRRSRPRRKTPDCTLVVTCGSTSRFQPNGLGPRQPTLRFPDFRSSRVGWVKSLARTLELGTAPGAILPTRRGPTCAPRVGKIAQTVVQASRSVNAISPTLRAAAARTILAKTKPTEDFDAISIWCHRLANKVDFLGNEANEQFS